MSFVLVQLKLANHKNGHVYFFLFQSESPSVYRLNSLGIYLLVSLFFVISTMVELVLVVFLKRVSEWKTNLIGAEVERNNMNINRSFAKSMNYRDIIDLIALFTYCIIYVISIN